MAANTPVGPNGSALFAWLPFHELIANFGVGYDNIDIVAAGVLAAPGSDGALINVSRGTVVALVAALQARTAAGLDVFAHEPHVDDGLLALDNVVLLRHIGFAAIVTRMAIGHATVGNLSAWLASSKPARPGA